MAKSLNLGFTDTPIPDVTYLEFVRGLVNYSADWRVKSDTSGEIVLTNLTSPIDRPEKIRVAYSEVSNIYNGTGIEPSLYSTTKRGVSIVVQVSEVASVTDNTDPDFRYDLPISAHLVIKTAVDELITPAIINTIIGRVLSGLFDTGSTQTTRLAAILRGSLKPSDL